MVKKTSPERSNAHPRAYQHPETDGSRQAEARRHESRVSRWLHQRVSCGEAKALVPVAVAGPFLFR